MWHIKLILLLLVCALSSCVAPPEPVSRNSVVDDLNVEIWASSRCVKPGETVSLRASVMNFGNRVQAIELKDKPILDIVFGNPDNGRRWSDGKPLIPDLTRLKLKPGESKTIEMNWIVPAETSFGPVQISAILNYNNKGDRVVPGVNVDVGICP